MFKHIPPVKYYFSRNKEFLRQIYRLTGFYPRNISIFKIAFTHKSASIQFDNDKYINNERLEYLGDAILAAVIADYLFSYFPFKKEGFLTKMRARIVSREQLNEIALKLGFQQLVVSQMKINGTKNIYGNAFEALIGAIYIDKGYKKTKKFIISRIIKKHININDLILVDSDYKSQLIEFAQKNKLEIQFDDSEADITEQNSPTFISKVILNGQILGTGTGTSKKEAQQNASREALGKVLDI
ncbi:MAG: ribonuclease III [Bacteroidetes bacterium GWC2_33_15]|nr:MAG: ribonuclease III [Bacteroidetes bacterium GWA2_33_15]OFX52698.1 MAG: ribonuclease III [Bacteroidetes bacterium GWC2_33_15]OFX63996.1 MAG: ribonuclease III [Bacteroidetes bacterium GWB2_32_14]OFX67319.1 MAG: ribonuclease III [Bacteroidetes bacterium GWD2_33_33]